MLPSTAKLLDHVKFLRQAAAANGAEFLIAGGGFQVLLRRGTWTGVLYPRFLTYEQDAPVLKPEFDERAHQFGGWVPYVWKQWPMAADRLLFKREASAAGLPVLEAFTDPAVVSGPVTVRSAQPARQHLAQGPYRTAADAPIQAEAGDYYEQFTEGEFLRAWYWNGVPVCAEIDRRACVVGDGVSTLEALVLHRASFTGPRSERDGLGILARTESLLRYYDVSLKTVLQRGARQTVDLGPDGPLMHPSDKRLIDFGAPPPSPWVPVVSVLRRAGEVVFAGIPEETRRDTLFTINAILDSEGQVRFCDMNSVSVVHPLVYPTMVRSLVFQGTEAAPAGTQA